MGVRNRSVVLVLAATLVVVSHETHAAIGPKVWFVDNSSAPSGDGSFGSPLTSLAAAEQHSGPGDWIFIRTGDGSTRGLDTGIRLKPNQTLLGEGVGLELGEDSVAPGVAPTVTNPDGHGVVLATGCEIAGIDIVSTGEAGIFGAEVKDCRLRDLRVLAAGGSGVELRGTAGDFALRRIEIDGAAGDGLSVRLDDTAEMIMTVEGCRFSGIVGTAVSLTVQDRASIRFQMARNSIVGAGMGIGLTVLDSARLAFHIVDNPEFSGIKSTIVNLFVDPDSTSRARASGEIARNPRMSKTPGSGFGIRISCNGDGVTTAVVRDNRITGGVDADFGILAEARLGAARLDLELTGNHVEVGDGALEAIVIRSRGSTRMCAHIEDNSASTIGGQVGLRLQQRGESVLALAGIDRDGIDQAMAERFMASVNPELGSVVATTDGGFSHAPEGCSVQKEMTQ